MAASNRIHVDGANPDPAAIARAADAIKAGGVVAFATDTLYGLAADPRSDAAVAKVFALKGRDSGTPLPLIAADVAQAQQAGELGPRALALARAFWPGPLSIVVEARPVVARAVVAGGTTVAVRVPAHPVARALASAFGFCITATSANPTGAVAPDAVASMDPGLAEAVDLVLDSGAAPGGAPSTLVAFDGERPILVRPGAIEWERVIKSLQ